MQAHATNAWTVDRNRSAFAEQRTRSLLQQTCELASLSGIRLRLFAAHHNHDAQPGTCAESLRLRDVR